MATAPSPTGLFSSANGTPSYLEFEKPLAQIDKSIHELELVQERTGRDHAREISGKRALLLSAFKKTYSNLSAWETVQVARHPKRPLLPDYLRMVVKDFCELHGDRNFRDDRAIVTGFGRMAGLKVMIVGHSKGRDTKERLENCFGMAHPEGYRKALLKMKLAAKFRVPIVCLIDTAGAYPGIGAEERGIAQAIAVNLLEISRLPTPIVCVVLGEGGSGGALGIGIGDRVAMMEHAWYSVISPEGCAAILWKSGAHAEKAAEVLKPSARELRKLGLVDDIIREPLGGAHREPETAALNLEKYVGDTLRELRRVKVETLLRRRYKRLREIGSFFEEAGQQPEPRTKLRRKPAPAGRARSIETERLPTHAILAAKPAESLLVPANQ